VKRWIVWLYRLLVLVFRQLGAAFLPLAVAIEQVFRRPRTQLFIHYAASVKTGLAADLRSFGVVATEDPTMVCILPGADGSAEQASHPVHNRDSASIRS